MDRITTRRSTKAHADLDVEKEVRERISARFPGHRIVGAESGVGGSGELAWYLDPVDGTTNFAHGLPWSSFSLALADASGALAGVVADPWRGELFSASRGAGARLGGVPIRCAETDSLAGAL